MKCQIIFLGEIRKKNTNLSSAELAQRVVKVKHYLPCLKGEKCKHCDGSK